MQVLLYYHRMEVTNRYIITKENVNEVFPGINSWESQCILMLNSILAQTNQNYPQTFPRPLPTTHEFTFVYIPTSSLTVYSHHI